MLRKEEWIIAFAAPRDSKIVWFMYAEPDGFFVEGDIKYYLEEQVKKGKLKVEEDMEVGGQRHVDFENMVECALRKAYGKSEDWRSLEYTRQV